MIHRWSAFGGAGHGRGLARRSWSVGSRRLLQRLGAQDAAPDVPGLYRGLIGPGDRKSIQPMAARDAGVSYDRCTTSSRTGVWDAAPLEAALLAEADRLVGGNDACADHRRYGAAEEGHALGRRRAAIRLGAWQERQLPDAGVADAGIGRSAGHGRSAAVPARELDERSRPARPRWRARWPSSLQDQAEIALAEIDRVRRRRRALRLRARRCRLWLHRSVPAGAERARPHLGSRHSASSRRSILPTWR